MPDSKDSNPSNPLEQSTAPLPSPATNKPFIPEMSVRDIQATYEMIVGARAAIRRNEHWTGEDLEAMAMLGQMLKNMEVQYREQLDKAKRNEADNFKRTKADIEARGGKINGTVAAPAVTVDA